MTFAEQNQLSDSLMELWKTILPECAPPDKAQFLLWTGVFPEPAVLRGINRACAKFRHMKNTGKAMTAHDAYRYANSVMRREAEGL